jgi:hypothetical protein
MLHYLQHVARLPRDNIVTVKNFQQQLGDTVLPPPPPHTHTHVTQP